MGTYAMYWNRTRCADSNLDVIAADRHDGDADVVSDDDLLVDFARKNQHARLRYADRQIGVRPSTARWARPVVLAAAGRLLI